MATKYALVVGGIVENVIVSKKKFVDELTGYDHIVELDNTVSSLSVEPGWKYNSGTQQFSVPDSVVETRPRHITVGAFFDRFGSKKYAILGANDAGIQARIKDASVRKYIDLNDPKVLEGLTYLQASKHAVDPTTVLNPPVREEERP